MAKKISTSEKRDIVPIPREQTIKTRKIMSIPKEIKSTIGDRLKSVRTMNNFSTNKFAEILGIAQSAITKIENGNSEPSAKTIIALYEKFGVDPLWLLTGKTSHVIQNSIALKIGQMADSLPDIVVHALNVLVQRETQLERILQDEKNRTGTDMPLNLDK